MAVSIGAGNGDIEGQDLIGVPGISQLVAAADFAQALVVDLASVARIDGPIVRSRLEVNIAQAPALESWNCGRISSTSARNLRRGLKSLEGCYHNAHWPAIEYFTRRETYGVSFSALWKAPD